MSLPQRSKTLTFSESVENGADLVNLFVVIAVYQEVCVGIPKASITWYLMTVWLKNKIC